MLMVTASQALGVLALIAAIVAAYLILRRPPQAAAATTPVPVVPPASPGERISEIRAATGRTSSGPARGVYWTPLPGGGFATESWDDRPAGAMAPAASATASVARPQPLVDLSGWVIGGGVGPAPAPEAVRPSSDDQTRFAGETVGMGRVETPSRPPQGAPVGTPTPVPQQPAAPTLASGPNEDPIRFKMPAGVEWKIFHPVLAQGPGRQTGEQKEMRGQLGPGETELSIAKDALWPGQWRIQYRDAQKNESRYAKFDVPD